MHSLTYDQSPDRKPNLSLSNQLKTFTDIDHLKEKLRTLESTVTELELWRSQVFMSLSKGIVYQSDFNLRMDLLKQEQTIVFQKQLKDCRESMLNIVETKMNSEDARKLVIGKVENSEFKAEI